MICNTVICNQLRLQVLDVRKQFFSPEWSDVRSVGMNTVLCLVVDGSAYVNIGEKTYHAKVGDMYLLPETEQSSFGCNSPEGLTLWYVHLKTEMPSGSLVKDPDKLTVKVADESAHVHRYAWPESNKYFDLCEDYADIAVHVVNIKTYNGQNTKIHTRMYVKLADGTVVYDSVYSATYNDPAAIVAVQ